MYHCVAKTVLRQLFLLPLCIALLAVVWGFIAVFVIIRTLNTLGHSPYICPL